MESNNTYKSFHILSEAVIMGGITIYFHKKISELESTIENLKEQITMQNNQIKYLIGSSSYHSQGTSLRINNNSYPQTTMVETSKQSFNTLYQLEQKTKTNDNTLSNVNCENGVCQLIPRPKHNDISTSMERKVMISKISKQIEFNGENNEFGQTSKVNTFTDFSPNPVLKSVTPRPSESMGDGNELEQILNDIDDE
jgi:hypothetical protein